jgi:hypothetical protein
MGGREVNLSKNMKSLFIKELEFVLKNMKSTVMPVEKLYFFSAIYAVANRIFNIEFHSELVFIHNVIQATHQQISTNLSVASQGHEITIGIPNGLFDGIEDAVEEMITGISNNQDISTVLQRISNLAYSTTGNGRYLLLKGMLHI